MDNRIKDTNDTKLGVTKVKVIFLAERNKRLVPEVVKHGVVVGRTTSFLRVFDPTKASGDVEAKTSELFPANGYRLFCEFAGEMSHPVQLPLRP